MSSFAGPEMAYREYDDRIADLTDRLASAVAALDEARKVIEPFAKLSQPHQTRGDDVPAYAINNAIVTFGDYRNCRLLVDDHTRNRMVRITRPAFGPPRPLRRRSREMTSGPEFQSYMAEQGDRDERDRNCHDCGVCEWCIQRTMEAAHDAAMAVLHGENEQLQKERDSALATVATLTGERDALKAKDEESLKLFMRFDCDWGCGCGKRHCDAHKPCTSHRLAAMTAEVATMRGSWETEYRLREKAESTVAEMKEELKGVRQRLGEAKELLWLTDCGETDWQRVRSLIFNWLARHDAGITK